MEGFIATWYARNTAKDLSEIRATARRIADRLEAGSRVLEVASGPGYLATELARLGRCSVAGLDISRSFVRIATENASRAGVAVEFVHGNASAMPFPGEAFDFLICRAAFKNFVQPLDALREMHRVLRPGGRALIIDMRSDVSDAAIDEEVEKMNLGRIDSLLTRVIFKHGLRKAAYSKSAFVALAAASPFGTCEIEERSIGMEIWLQKQST